ncbi:MAG: MerR family transcriptional regulator [Actinomycetota bacterium]|nr:MerR family transcriptional regulator [Actinomycetota bacterium]
MSGRAATRSRDRDPAGGGPGSGGSSGGVSGGSSGGASAGSADRAGVAAGPAPDGDGCGDERLLSIGAAAARAGVTERALRYYQEIGILSPSARTKGGMRRYSEADLDRVTRIRELQQLLGYNLDEIADVLRNEDRSAQIRAAYHEATADPVERRRLLSESLALATELRQTVEAKRAALEAFLADLDHRIGRIRAVLDELGPG